MGVVQLRPAQIPLGPLAGGAGVEAEGQVRMAQAMANLGNTIAEVDATLTKARRATALNEAVTKAVTGLGELELSYERDQDFRTAPKRFTEQVEALRSQMELGIEDDVVKQAFNDKFNQLAAVKRLNVLKVAARQEQDFTVAQLDSDLDMFSHKAANARSVVERAQLIDEAHESIERLRSAGWITDVDANRRWVGFATKLDLAGVTRDLVIDPGGTAKKLETNPEYAKNLDVVMREQLIDRGYRRADQAMAQIREALRLKVTDTTAAYERGVDVPDAPSRSELLTAFGELQGTRIADELERSRQFGQDVRKVQGLSASQQKAFLAARTPQSGDGFADAARRHDQLVSAVKSVQEEREKDPALFTVQTSSAVRSAYNRMASVTADPTGTPKTRAAAAQAYAQATIAEQTRLEIRDPQILPKAMVDSIAKTFAAQPVQGQNVASVMRGMVDQWGRYWPLVQKQIGNRLPPEATVVGLGVTPEAEALLAEAAQLKPEQLRQGLAEGDMKDIRERIRSQFEPLQRSLAWQTGGIATYDNYVDSAEKIAVSLVQKGIKPKDAAAKTFESLIGFKYEFEETWRVPKASLSAETTMGALRAGAEALKLDVGSETPVIGKKVPLLVPAVSRSVRAEDAERQWRDTIVSNGFWVTSPGDGGLTLYVKSGLGAQPVLDDRGIPVRRTWAEISAAGNSVRAAYFGDLPKRRP